MPRTTLTATPTRSVINAVYENTRDKMGICPLTGESKAVGLDAMICTGDRRTRRHSFQFAARAGHDLIGELGPLGWVLDLAATRRVARTLSTCPDGPKVLGRIATSGHSLWFLVTNRGSFVSKCPKSKGL